MRTPTVSGIIGTIAAAYDRFYEEYAMSKTVRAIIHKGKIEPLEEVNLPEGSKVLVTLLADEEAAFWVQASHASLEPIWDNPEDDVYAQLLKE